VIALLFSAIALGQAPPAEVQPQPEPTLQATEQPTATPPSQTSEPQAQTPEPLAPEPLVPEPQTPETQTPEPQTPDPPTPETQTQAPDPHPSQPQTPTRQPLQTPAPAVDDFFGFFDDPGTPDVVVVDSRGDQAISLLEPILPHPPRSGLHSALPLLFLAALFGLIATLLRRVASDLRSSGLIPQVLRTSEVLFRLLVAIFVLGAVGALTPRSLAPALPVVGIAIAVAIGWSARDILQDLIAGVFIGVEGQLRAGNWVRGDKYSGTVEAIGLRVTWLRDVYGRRIIVPNRVLLANPLVADDNPWPRIQFTVAMPCSPVSGAVRHALEEAIIVSPWVAPDPEVEVHPDGIISGHWHIAVRLLDSRYADRFQGLLRERVEEILPCRPDPDSQP